MTWRVLQPVDPVIDISPTWQLRDDIVNEHDAWKVTVKLIETLLSSLCHKQESVVLKDGSRHKNCVNYVTKCSAGSSVSFTVAAITSAHWKKNPSHKYRKLENGDHLIDSAVIRSHRNIFFFTKNVTISRYVFLLCYSKPSPKVITSISPLYISSSTTFPVFFKINVLIRLDSSSLIFWKCKRYLTSTVLNLHT